MSIGDTAFEIVLRRRPTGDRGVSSAGVAGDHLECGVGGLGVPEAGARERRVSGEVSSLTASLGIVAGAPCASEGSVYTVNERVRDRRWIMDNVPNVYALWVLARDG